MPSTLITMSSRSGRAARTCSTATTHPYKRLRTLIVQLSSAMTTRNSSRTNLLVGKPGSDFEHVWRSCRAWRQRSSGAEGRRQKAPLADFAHQSAPPHVGARTRVAAEISRVGDHRLATPLATTFIQVTPEEEPAGFRLASVMEYTTRQTKLGSLCAQQKEHEGQDQDLEGNAMRDRCFSEL